MTNDYQNLNISGYNSANANIGGTYNYSTPQVNENYVGQENYDNSGYYYDEEYEYENPSHTRLNALDSTLLESEAYQNIDDEVFKTEYKIERIENEIKSLDKEIENAKKINDFQKVDILTMRKHSLETNLNSLYESYGESDVTTRLSGGITSILSFKPTAISNAFEACKEFITDKVLPKSGKDIKDALTKLETLNKNVDELVTMQTPYGEADERYDKLTNYLNRANVIHFQISKTIGTPTFFDTISSIDKEKLNQPKTRTGFNSMTGRKS